MDDTSNVQFRLTGFVLRKQPPRAWRDQLYPFLSWLVSLAPQARKTVIAEYLAKHAHGLSPSRREEFAEVLREEAGAFAAGTSAQVKLTWRGYELQAGDDERPMCVSYWSFSRRPWRK